MTRTEATGWLTANEAALVADQDATLASQRRYGQVLPGNRKPPHRGDAVKVAIPTDFRIDEYAGPRGKGWAITLRAVEGVDEWVRVKDYGPDGWTHAWRRA